MRPLYFLLKFLLKITLWIYYPRFKNVNKPKKRFARTIYMSNHASSFMDPLVVAGTQRPIIFFMTRSDIFTPLMRPRSEEHTSELQSRPHLVCRLLLEKK